MSSAVIAARSAPWATSVYACSGALRTSFGYLHTGPPTHSAGSQFVARVDMSVKPLHRVAEHLVVDAPKVVIAARALDRLAKERQVEQERCAANPVQISQVVRLGVIANQHE